MRIFAAFLVLATSVPALAHPGEHHAGVLGTLWHLVADPFHLTLIVAAVACATVAAIRQRRRAKAGER
ncbi:MAG: hypothetical protein WDZ63_09975 [Burkholderiales bacterium]